MSEVVPEELTFPWDHQRVTDLVQVFKDAWQAADEQGAEGERSLCGLLAVLRVLAWELDALPVPEDPSIQRTLLIQHVLHRLGDQGNGN